MTETVESALEQLELERKQLENDKLRAEVDQARLSWWKRPGYFAGAAPILIALAGVFTAWVTGYFDTQREQLATEISVLEKDVGELAAEKEALESDRSELEAANAELEDSSARLAAEKSTLELERIALLAESEKLSQEIAAAKQSLDLAYLRIRVAAEDAKYALKHFESYAAETGDYTQYIIERMDALPDDVQPQMFGLFELLANRFNVVLITQESLGQLDDRLASIETSPWTKTLRWEPFLSQEGLMQDEDGKYYDIENGRFLTDEEAQARLPTLFRPVSDD